MKLLKEQSFLCFSDFYASSNMVSRLVLWLEIGIPYQWILGMLCQPHKAVIFFQRGATDSLTVCYKEVVKIITWIPSILRSTPFRFLSQLTFSCRKEQALGKKVLKESLHNFTWDIHKVQNWIALYFQWGTGAEIYF